MPSATIASVCKAIDPSEVPDFFSRYPAAISVNASEVENALRRIGDEASEPNSRERRRARIRLSNPRGDPFAICHCSADPERLVLLASIVEVMWIHDDITEELDHNLAGEEHSVLAEVLQLDTQPSKLCAKNKRQRALAALLRRAIDLDPSTGPQLVEMLRDYLQTFDSRDITSQQWPSTCPTALQTVDIGGLMRKHMDISCSATQSANVRRMSSFFIRWGMGVSMSNDDYASIRQFDVAMGNVLLGLTNDYFSWHIERDQPTDRVRNGVRVLMQEHGVPENVARRLLLGIIVQEESRAAKLKEDRLKSPIHVSKDIALYFEAIELYVGGSCYWHSTAPRYKVFE